MESIEPRHYNLKYMDSKAEEKQKLNRVSTGVPALDAIMQGGLPKGEIYLVNGAPGTGKTILALHFLQAGVRAGEKSLCIALYHKQVKVSS